MNDNEQYRPKLGQCRAYMLWSESLIFYAKKQLINQRGRELFAEAYQIVSLAFKNEVWREDARSFLFGIAHKYHFKKKDFTNNNKNYWLKIFLFEFAARKEAEGDIVTYEEYGIKPLIKKKKIGGIRRCFAIGKSRIATKGNGVYNTYHIFSVPMGGMNKKY